MPRPEAPRHFVIVEPAAGKTLVYGGTPTVTDVVETAAWARVYRERHERPAHRGKRMIGHGARNTNEGRKTRVGPDRQQQRQRAPLAPALLGAHQRVATKTAAVNVQQAKGAESASKGHGQRLEQRQRALAVVEQALQDAQHKHDTLAAPVAALGPPGQRAERAFRKQTIMTVRTLLLEHALMACRVVRGARLQTKGSRDGLVRLLCERSGARMETDFQVVYWVNTAGFSVAYQRLLKELVEGLSAIDLQDQGKPICVRLKDMPP